MAMARLRSPQISMNTKDLGSDLQACVLAALASVPLDQARLFESVFRLSHRSRAHRCTEREDSTPQFFDALALLQADGLVTERPHPLREFRRYYLTEKGDEVAKRLGLATRKRLPADDSACGRLTPA
jgi:DNA-binding PadR family transcriptional regulator